jgi:hypothetical protein
LGANTLQRILLCLWLASEGAQLHAQTETQHGFDLSVRLRQRLDLVLHSRIRTQPGRLGFYQIRSGPILEYSVAGVKWIGGYYYTQQESSEEDFIGGHRVFGGAEARLWNGGRVSGDLRMLAERFDLARGRDFARYRLRLRASGRAALAPYGSVEPFFDNRGWRSTRYALGVRVRSGSRISVDFGYFMEPRRNDVGPLRHMFLTGVHWNFGTKRRGDPDL